MKLRNIQVMLDIRTDIPRKWLRDRRRWQTLLDMMHRKTLNPLADYAIVGKVKLNDLPE